MFHCKHYRMLLLEARMAPISTLSITRRMTRLFILVIRMCSPTSVFVQYFIPGGGACAHISTCVIVLFVYLISGDIYSYCLLHRQDCVLSLLSFLYECLMLPMNTISRSFALLQVLMYIYILHVVNYCIWYVLRHALSLLEGGNCSE